MRRRNVFCSGLLCLIVSLLSARAASAQNTPETGQPPYEWNYALPIFGKRLAERGITFPLPWGVGLNYAWIDQPIRIQDLEIGLNGSDFVNLDEIVKFDRVDASVHALNARVDVWLFPFMNVYALGNYAVQAKTDVRLSEPFPLNAGAVQPGGGGGLGTTLAMGAWGFFATLDFNWTRNKMQKLIEPVDTLLLAPRVGRKLFKIGKFEMTVWVGAMWQRIGVATRGKIRLSEAIGEPSDEVRMKIEDWYGGLPPARQAVVRTLVEEIRSAAGEDPTIYYRLSKEVQNPWNMLAGTQLEVTENWMVRAEFGFIKRTQVIIGLNYRFGLF
jgi:opacity protein-like surface antigen